MHKNDPKNASLVAAVYFTTGYPISRKSAHFPLKIFSSQTKNPFLAAKCFLICSFVSNSSHRAAWSAASQGKVPEGSTLKTSLKAAHQQIHTLKTSPAAYQRSAPKRQILWCEKVFYAATHFCYSAKHERSLKRKLHSCSRTHASKQISFDQSWTSTVFDNSHFASLCLFFFSTFATYFFIVTRNGNFYAETDP